MNRILCAALFLACACGLDAQQLPAGTHEAPDPRAPAAVATSTAQTRQIAQAESALEQHDYAAAEKTLTALAAAQPTNGQVLYDLGFAQEAQNKDSAAARSYAAAVAASPTLGEPRVALGLLDARTGRDEEAHRLLTEASTLTTALPALRGRALRALATLDAPTHPDAARTELLAAVRLTGDQSGDLKLTADLAAKAQDWTDAEAAFRKVVAADPADMDATASLGRALQKQGKLAEADALLSSAATQHPSSAALVAGLASVEVAEGKTADAITAVESLRRLSPPAAADPATTRLLARLDALAGDNAAAEALYTGLLAARPDDPTLLDALGSAQVKQGRYAAAQATLARAVALRSAFPSPADWAEAAGHLAFAASKNGNPTLTLQALADRATVLPNSPASLFLEATAHDTLHQTREAERAYRAFLAAAGGKYPDQEFQARHRLIALEHQK